jgi:hypothetical protein
MVVSHQKGISVPLVRPEVRRDFCGNALAFGRVLQVRGGDQDQVHVNHVLRRMVFLPQLQLSSLPGRTFMSHAAKVTMLPSPMVARERDRSAQLADQALRRGRHSCCLSGDASQYSQTGACNRGPNLERSLIQWPQAGLCKRPRIQVLPLFPPPLSCNTIFGVAVWRTKEAEFRFRVKRYWEIIADNLSKAGWSWGCVSAVDSRGRTIWIADAHRDDGKRYIVRADEQLTAFLELESAIRQPVSNFGFSETWPSDSICAAGRPRREKRNQAEKLSSRHREHSLR